LIDRTWNFLSSGKNSYFIPQNSNDRGTLAGRHVVQPTDAVEKIGVQAGAGGPLKGIFQQHLPFVKRGRDCWTLRSPTRSPIKQGTRLLSNSLEIMQNKISQTLPRKPVRFMERVGIGKLKREVT
jgi:hypothetical protein